MMVLRTEPQKRLKKAALRINLLGDYTYVQETIIQAANKNLKIFEVPVEFRKRGKIEADPEYLELRQKSWNDDFENLSRLPSTEGFSFDRLRPAFSGANLWS